MPAAHAVDLDRGPCCLVIVVHAPVAACVTLPRALLARRRQSTAAFPALHLSHDLPAPRTPRLPSSQEKVLRRRRIHPHPTRNRATSWLPCVPVLARESTQLRAHNSHATAPARAVSSARLESPHRRLRELGVQAWRPSLAGGATTKSHPAEKRRDQPRRMRRMAAPKTDSSSSASAVAVRTSARAASSTHAPP